MSDPLHERLNKILPRVVSDEFLSGSGIGNEIAFYIFDYPPEDELRVRDYLRTLLDHIPRQKHGLRVKHVNLFDFVLDYLKHRNLLDKVFRKQREEGDEAVKKALAGPLNVKDKLIPYFCLTVQPHNFDLVIVSGVGSVYPLLRTSTLLTNLQSVMGRTPLVLFYPGKYDQVALRLFGKLRLADTGSYPGRDEITHGLTLINPLLADKESKKFIERFNTLKKDLLDLADQFHDLEHFYDHQRPTWEKLRKAHAAFQLNRLELEKDAQAGPALKRMQEVLSAPCPYGLVKEADGLIHTVDAVNSALLTGRRAQAVARIDAHIATLNKDIAAAQGEAGLRAACVKPLEALKEQVQKEESLAHITQAEGEAVREFDAAVGRIEDFVRKMAEQKKPKDDVSGKVPPPPAVKTQRVVKPADLVKTPYLETTDDVNGFLDALRMVLEQAVAKNERIQIR